MKILTVNRHEAYLLMLGNALSRLRIELYILTSLPNEDLTWKWDDIVLPKGMHLITWDEIAHPLKETTSFDCLIMHTIKDVWFFSRFLQHIPSIFIIHIALYSHSLKFKVRSFLKKIILKIARSRQKIYVVATSQWKGETWGINLDAIIRTPPLPTKQVAAYTEPLSAIVVGNRLQEREEVDFSLFTFLSHNTPLKLIGNNPQFPHAIIPKGRTNFVNELAKHQIFVFILRYPWEDGYNLAMLEAMQSGMAVLTLSHPHTIIEDGSNGFVCESQESMKEKLIFLLQSPILVEKFGKRSQEIVKERFSEDQFEEEWRRMLLSNPSLKLSTRI